MRIRGVDLHVEDVGEGSPILFSHGLLWSSRMWAPQVEALRGRHRCVSYDHCGQGRSGNRGQRSISIDSLYADAVALIEALDLAPCHFVGLSMGGFVGLRVAARRPELVRSLVLVSSCAHAEVRAKIFKYRSMMFGLRLGLGRRLGDAVGAVMFGRTFLGDPARQAEREPLLEILRSLDMSIAPAVRGVMERDSVLDACAKIVAPTLALHGEEDRAIPVQRARETAAAIRGAELTLLPHAGHTPTQECPDAVSEALGAFLEQH